MLCLAFPEFLSPNQHKSLRAAAGQHPLKRLQTFYLGCDEEQLERRCKLAAEHNLHLPVLAWLTDANTKLHNASVHILAEITNFASGQKGGLKWAQDVTETVTELGGVQPVLDRFHHKGEESAIKFAAILLANLAMTSEQTSRIITKCDAPATAMRVIQKYNVEDEDECAVACARLLSTLTTNEENQSDLCYNRTMLADLVLCLKNPVPLLRLRSSAPSSAATTAAITAVLCCCLHWHVANRPEYLRQVLKCRKHIYDTLANLSLDRYMKDQMSTPAPDGSITPVQTMVIEIIKAQHNEANNTSKGVAVRDSLVPGSAHLSLVPLVRLIANVSVNVSSHQQLVPLPSMLPNDLASNAVAFTLDKARPFDDPDDQPDDRNPSWSLFLKSVHALLSNTQSQELQLQLVRMIRNLSATAKICEKIVGCGGAAALFLVRIKCRLPAVHLLLKPVACSSLSDVVLAGDKGY